MKMLNFITNCYYLTYNRTVVCVNIQLQTICHTRFYKNMLIINDLR